MKKLIIILAVVIFAVSGIFVIGSLTGNAVKENNNIEEKNIDSNVEIQIEAFRFGYKPDVLTASVGDNIKIKINNADVPHGIKIPELGLSGESTLEFKAEKAGEFTWYCYIPCGSGHKEMQGKIIIR